MMPLTPTTTTATTATTAATTLTYDVVMCAGAVSLVNDAPNAYYTGFLLKSFDLQTGAYIGRYARAVFFFLD